MTVPHWIIDVLRRYCVGAISTPYFHLDGYMLRYWVLGDRSPDRNAEHSAWHGRRGNALYRWITRRVAARMHVILRSDTDRALHDHPWSSLSIVLANGYWEVCEPTARAREFPQIRLLLERDLHTRRASEQSPAYLRLLARYGIHWRGPGAVVARRACTAHRLVLYGSGPADSGVGVGVEPTITLFLMGRKRNAWGFYPRGLDQPKVGWREYLQQERS